MPWHSPAHLAEDAVLQGLLCAGAVLSGPAPAPPAGEVSSVLLRPIDPLA